MTIKNFREKMLAKAKKYGITENFGQKEIRKLKEKYSNDYEASKKITELENWCMNFDLSQF